MERITVKLIGEDGNIFNLLGITRREMRRAGQKEQADEMMEKVEKCESYSDALNVISQYVDIE